MDIEATVKLASCAKSRAIAALDRGRQKKLEETKQRNGEFVVDQPAFALRYRRDLKTVETRSALDRGKIEELRG